MLRFFLLFFGLTSIVLYSQEDLLNKHFMQIDSLYREDQFYFGLGINILSDMPDGMNQSGLSGGFHAGYIRDMPINQRRNISIGMGLGFAYNTYSQNLFIGEDTSGNTIFNVIGNNIDYSTNRFITQEMEVPFQFRWRTSNINDNTSFWRIYAGVNLGYIFYFKSRFEQSNITVTQTNLDELNRLRWSLYFAFGKSKINFYFKYTLNPMFSGNLTENASPVNVRVIQTGIVFYIL
jgi:hypothetical protein